MKPPDEKTIDELNAAERGRTPRGKWRIIIAVLITLSLLLVGSLAGVEGYRHSEIRSARAKLEHEVARVDKRYESVTDWHQWYIEQLPDDCAHREFREWLDACTDSNLSESSVVQWMDVQIGDPVDAAEPRPSVKDLEEFLNKSWQTAKDARALAPFEHIALIPEIEDGVPVYGVIATVGALQLLRHRVTALRMLGETDLAWRESTDTLRFIQRWDRPTSLVDQMVQVGTERSLISDITKLLTTGPPARDRLTALVDQPPTRQSLERDLFEFEIAFFAQVFGTLTPAERENWSLFGEEDSPEWFPYLVPDLSWKERKSAFSGEAEMTRATAEYLHQTLDVLEDPKLGVADCDPQNPLFSPLFRVPRTIAEIELRRQGLALLCQLALLEHRDEVPQAVLQLRGSYPDYVDPEDEEQFYRHFEPVVLPLPE